MIRHPLIPCLALILVGCSAVPIQDVDEDELEVTLDYRHRPDRVNLEAELRTGFWNRRVDAGSDRPEVITAGGEIRRLRRGIDAGQYGLELEPELGPYRLVLPGIAEITLPLGEAVRLRGAGHLRGQLFNRDDELSLDVRGRTDRPRGWSFTAHCGAESWTINRGLDRGDARIDLPLASLMRQINNAAEADLNGQIPVTVTLWERYDLDWRPPFKPGVARAQDEVDFQVDTASFRFQARINVRVSNNLFLGFQNQAWPVRYCY